MFLNFRFVPEFKIDIRSLCFPIVNFQVKVKVGNNVRSVCGIIHFKRIAIDTIQNISSCSTSGTRRVTLVTNLVIFQSVSI
jgi:hypothetical protein